MKRLTFLILAAIVLAAPAWADTYKWTDADGHVHYSDNPPQGVNAQRVDMPALNTMRPPAPPPPSASTGSSGAGSGNGQGAPAEQTYDGLAVLQPAPEANIWADDGKVNVNLSVSPRLFPGDGVIVLMDGNRMTQPTPRLTFTLENVNPGEHSLMAVIVNGEGQVMVRSPAVKIYVHHHSILRKH